MAVFIQSKGLLVGVLIMRALLLESILGPLYKAIRVEGRGAKATRRAYSGMLVGLEAYPALLGRLGPTGLGSDGLYHNWHTESLGQPGLSTLTMSWQFFKA